MTDINQQPGDLLDIDFGDLDFDLDDFNFDDVQPDTKTRILQPRIDKVQIAFGAYHQKIITLSTHHGNTLTIHGSANARSSMNIEQIMVEPNNRELHEFNARMIADICDNYGTINHDAEIMTRADTRKWFDEMREGRDPHGIRQHKGRETRRKQGRKDSRV